MHDKRIFITGATGLVGSHILRLLLARGYTNIVALHRDGSPKDLVASVRDRVEWITGDLTNTELVYEAMSGAHAAIHSAALISYQSRHYAQMHEVNVGGTANVVNASLQHGVSRLVHMSSMAAITRNGGQQHVDETTTWEETRYTSEYGLTKHLSEMEVWRGKAEGLQVSMILPTLVMGSGFWKTGSSSMFYKAGKGLAFYPIGTTGFVDVRDLALLTVLAMEQVDAPERMIACGHNRSLEDVLGSICEMAGKKRPGLALPPWAGEIIWRLLAPTEWITGKEPLLSKSAVRTTSCKQTFDNSRSLSVEGFAYTPLQQTLDDVMTNYKLAASKNFAPIPMDFLPPHLMQHSESAL